VRVHLGEARDQEPASPIDTNGAIRHSEASARADGLDPTGFDQHRVVRQHALRVHGDHRDVLDREKRQRGNTRRLGRGDDSNNR
jgi:hypothetical protein